MIQDIFAIAWLFLAAGVSNSAPVFANRIPLVKQWDSPMDFGKKFRNKRIFGQNKTWRGIIAGIVSAIIIVLAQKMILQLTNSDIYINEYSFSQLPTLALGVALGAGPLIGDAIESFFKRQINVPPGKSWVPFDQIDYIIGASIFVTPIVTLIWWQYLVLLLLGFCVHLISSYIGYLIGLKESPI